MGQTGPDGNDADLQRRSKISPHLQAMVLDWEQRQRTQVPAGAKSRETDPVPFVSVLIELKRPDTSELEQAGVDFKPLFGLFYSADVPLDRLDSLADLDSILRVHHEPEMKPTLDDSIPEIRANTVRNPHHPFSGTNKFTGLGVMVGIIDSGINPLHPVFRLPNDQTKTRIRAILDQTQSPARTVTNGEIQTAIAAGTQVIPPGAGTPRVETGKNDHKHGTHVAGIAAGNGKIAGNCSGEFKYVGVAPEAELVIVKWDFGGAPSLLAAIQFIANIAAAVPGGGVPAVINMSFGTSIGPHDGTGPLDTMIDTFLATRPPGSPPVVLVASSGNEGGHSQPGPPKVSGDDSHATGAIPPGGVVKRLRFELQDRVPTAAPVKTSLEIWFTAPNGLGCRLIPLGNTITGSNLAAPDGPAAFTEDQQHSNCTITGVLVPGGAPGARRIIISILSAANGKNQPGDWTIELTNAGAAPITYHAWIVGEQFERFKDDLSRANTVGSPGSSTSVITVGNYASSGKDKGKIADTSSRGPRVDGVQKPDISAPGQEICSAKRDFHIGCCCDCCCDSYIDENGTSMSAPHVTGAIALMLERNPALTHQQIKTILLANARRDSFTGAAPNNDFGNGKLDVLALLNDPLVRGTGPVISSSGVSRGSLTAEAAQSIPAIPQLEEGTPLWRLLQTEEGKRLYELGRTHWEELRGLVNGNKRVATVWHRNYGPLMLHHIARTAMLTHVPLPRELDGEEIRVRAARLVSALEVHASPELVKALHSTLPLVARLQGKTLLELVEIFESSRELQHA